MPLHVNQVLDACVVATCELHVSEHDRQPSQPKHRNTNKQHEHCPYQRHAQQARHGPGRWQGGAALPDHQQPTAETGLNSQPGSTIRGPLGGHQSRNSGGGAKG